jgi:ribosome-associated toxin RatA of RatAB toxin-antitoxin module
VEIEHVAVSAPWTYLKGAWTFAPG